MKYIVMANVHFGIDDTLDVEYSGIEHDTYDDAKAEMIGKAIDDPQVISAYIAERYD
jgi:hypothetical protein